MFKGVLKRFISISLTLFILLSTLPNVFAAEETDVSVEPQAVPASPSDIIYADGEDPLMSVATVTTGGNAASYVEIDSTYVPGGYTTRSTGTSAYTTAPGNDFSYHTSRNGSTSNSYVITPTNDLSWSKNSGNTGVTGSLSDTAVSDNKACGENGALCAKVNSKVLRIYALTDLNVSFDFSSTLTINNSAGQGNIMEGVYTLKTTSSSPSISQIKGGIVRSNTNKTDLSKTVSGSGSVSESIQQGEYLYIYFYSFFSNQSSSDVDTTKYTYTASVTDFEITPVTENYSLAIGNSDCAGNLIGGGKITVNGIAITIPASGTAAGLTDVLSGTSVSLSVNSVPSGYFHIGWQIGDTTLFTKTYDFSLDTDKTVYALLIPQVTVTMGSNGYADAAYSYKNPSGNTVNAADQYIARNSNATAYYKTLNEAFSANDVVVLLGNIVLNGDFTIPAGKTLSIQRDWTDPATSALQQLAESAGLSIFAKATINGTVLVQGNLVASGVQGTNDGVNGRATGGVGHLIINGTVNVVSGGKLCAYGMITGPGHVNVASGGNVYELMEIRDMRSVYVLPTVADGKTGDAFPFNCYFIKTNEVSTTYSAGAQLIVSYYVSISGIKSNGYVTVIGSNNALFNINSGSITKCFSSVSPYNNKMIFRVESESDIQSGKFSINVSASGFSKTIDTSKYYLPLNYCFAIEVMNGGSLTLNCDYKLLPGALVDVKKGGTLNIASGKKLVLYRANDYKFNALSGFCATAYPTAFTKPGGLTYASNTAANVGSAKLNVDGTLNVVGGLYVTDQLTGATTYANGYNYLTGTGAINITSNQSNGTIKEWTQSDSQNASSVNVDYVPIKGITDAGQTSDDGQTGYTSFAKKTWYGHINASGVNYWDNVQETAKYTVTWLNSDGSVLETDENVEEGTMPEYNGTTPAKAADDEHEYEFAGWTPEIAAVTGDVTYTATYTATEHTWSDPVWNWIGSDGVYSGATVTLTCAADNKSKTLIATVTSVTTVATCVSTGQIVYTATATLGDATYTDSKTVTTPVDPHNHADERVNTFVSTANAETLIVHKCFACYSVISAEMDDNATSVKDTRETVEVKISNFSLNISNSIAINFLVRKSVIDNLINNGYTDIHMQFYKEDCEGAYQREGDIVFNSANTQGDYYKFTFKGVRAKEMNDDVYATLYATAADGTVYRSKTIGKSIFDYTQGTSVLNSSATDPATAALKTAIVDMLNYGAAAQVNFEYGTERLVTSRLTDEQRALATAGDPVLTQTKELTSLPGAPVKIKNAALSLNDTVEIYVLTDMSALDSTSGVYLRVWQEDNGTVVEKSRIASFSDYEYNNTIVKRFNISTIMFKEMDQEYYMAVYNSAGEQISSKLRYSIGAYCNEVISGSSNENLKDVCKQIMKFSASAKAYFELQS